jgi:hypothetical protein
MKLKGTVEAYLKEEPESTPESKDAPETPSDPA